MRIIEKKFEYEVIEEGKLAYQIRGNKLVKAIRCTAGRRKGRVVSNASDCFKKKNIKLMRSARINSKKNKAKKARMRKITARKGIHKTKKRLNRR